MAAAISLSDCQLQVWRQNSSSKSLALSGLGLSISPDGGAITIKQFSELSPTSSCVAYKLRLSHCTYISSEYISADVRIVYLRLEEPVSATICIDENTSLEAVADEIATLQLCPMVDTKLPLGCKLDLIMPQEARYATSISKLLRIFGDGPRVEKELVSQLQFTTIIHKDKSQSTSITLSNEDLEYLETSTNPDPDRARSDQNRRPKQKQQPRQRRGSPVPSTATESRELERSLRIERALVDNWAKQREMWDQLSKPKRQNKSEAQPIAPELVTDANEDSRNQWLGFAASHASPGDIQSTPTRWGRALVNPVPGPIQTGGHLQHLNRDYDQSDSQQLLYQGTAMHRGYRGRGRGRGRFKAASFIPPTNATWNTRPEPNW